MPEGTPMITLTSKVDEMKNRAEAMMAETRMQFDTLVTMHSDERREMRQAFQAEKDKMRKHYGRIIAGLIIALTALLGGIIGGFVYVVSNFDIIGATYQETYDESQIQDGIHIDIGK